MASYLPMLVASPPRNGHVLKTISQLEPTEGLCDQKSPVPLVELIWGLFRSGFYPSEWKGWGLSGNSVFCANISAFAVVVFLATWLAEEEPGHIFKGASARLEASYSHPHVIRRGGEAHSSTDAFKCKIRFAGH